MIILLNILIIVSVVAVLVTLILGALNMRKSDMAARLKANKLMRFRIISQISAVAFLVLLVLVKSKTQGG